MNANGDPADRKRRRRAQRLSNRGAEYLRQGNAHSALSLLQRAYDLVPDDVPTAINLGGAYILRKQFSHAIPILEQACEQEPGNEMLWIGTCREPPFRLTCTTAFGLLLTVCARMLFDRSPNMV